MFLLQTETRTVRKSDYMYTPALALPEHMANIFDEKCGEKEKGVSNRRKPVLNPTIQQVTVNLYNKFLSHDTHCLCYSVYLNELSIIYLRRKCRAKEGKYMEEYIEESWFSIRQCNKSMSIYIRNINLLL